MYWHMHSSDAHLRVERGMALHKLIRLITLAAGGHGYLNFMGNEFGHPEWIDFPREGNAWSFRYARRQWYLADDPSLKYRFLSAFDRAMIALVRTHALFGGEVPHLLHERSDTKVMAFERAGLVFAFNFHPSASHVDYRIDAPPGKYRTLLDSDSAAYGGQGRLDPDQEHFTLSAPAAAGTRHQLSLYLPSRVGLVLEPTHG